MKRYFLFSYDNYYPSGGMNDFINHFEKFEEAKEEAKKAPFENIQIFDIFTGEVFHSTKDGVDDALKLFNLNYEME